VTRLGLLSRAASRRRPFRFLRVGVLAPAIVTVLGLVVLPPSGAATADQLSQAKAEAAQIVAQIQAQGQQLAVLSEQYDQDQIKVQQLGAQLDQTRARVADTRGQVATARANLQRQAIDDYTSGGAANDLEELFSSPNAQASVVQEYQQVASGNVSGAIDRFDQAEAVLSAQEAQLQATESQAQATLAQTQAARQGAQSALATQQATLSKVKGQIATLVAQQQAAEAAAQQRAFEARVAAQEEAAAQRAAAAGAASGGAAGEPSPVAAAPDGEGALAVAAAETQIGVPYVWGGSTPGAGFDCSGLTMWAWAHAGVALSHSAADQYDETVHVPLSDLQPGDLLFYDEGGIIGHVTMYVGPGEMIQAMETGTRIQITGIWTNGLVGAGRP